MSVFFLFFFFRIKFFFHLKIFEKKNFILKKKKDKKIMKKKNFSNSSKKNIRKKLTWYGTPSHLTIEILILLMTPCFKKDILSFPFRPKNFAQTNCFFSALASKFCFYLFQAQTFFENYQASFPKKKAVESRLRFIRLLAQKRKRWQVHFLFFVQSCFFKANFSNFKKKSFFLLQLLPRKIIRTHSEANYNFLIFA